MHALQTTISKLDKLSGEDTISFTRFSRLENELYGKISRLREIHGSLITTVLASEPLLMGDEELRKDSDNIESLIDTCLDDLDKLRQRSEIQQAMQQSTPVPDGSESLSDILKCIQAENTKIQIEQSKQMAARDKHMESLISNLSKSQSDNISSLITSTSYAAPKPSQPFFKSNETDADFETFRDFLPRFEHFVFRLKSDKHKLEYLMSSVSGDALALIKNLPLEDVNYKIALDKLKKKYLNSDFIKEKLLSSILNFKFEHKIKINKVPSVITGLTNDIDALKSTHKVDCYRGSGTPPSHWGSGRCSDSTTSICERNLMKIRGHAVTKSGGCGVIWV